MFVIDKGEVEEGREGEGDEDTMLEARRRRFPVAKRALQMKGEEGVKRRKKEAKTEPKVAAALSHIFSDSKSNETEERKKKDEEKKEKKEVKEEAKKEVKKEGEKERVEEVTKVKKSVDWSEYFGMDRRKKKWDGEEEDGKMDQFLLDQYYRLLSENMARKKIEGGEEDENEEDPLGKLEDAIVEEAIKDTGAHEGGERREVEEAKARVLTRLAAAYGLEKMRKALAQGKGERISDGYPMRETEVEEKKRDDGVFVGPPISEPLQEVNKDDDVAEHGHPFLQEEDGSDSLRPALEAISRRQRDLRTYDNYGGLGRYRYEAAKRDGDQLEFLTMGDGQPEDIGYGYQRGGPLVQQGGASGRDQNALLERLLMEYLDGSNKRSAFRERAAKGPSRTAFREREEEVDKKKRFMALVKRLEEEEEEEEEDDRKKRGEEERKRGEGEEEERKRRGDGNCEEGEERKEEKRDDYDYFNSPFGWMGSGGIDAYGRRRRDQQRLRYLYRLLEPSAQRGEERSIFMLIAMFAEQSCESECPALERLTTNCEGIGDMAGDYLHLFLDLCNWHEVCSICGSATPGGPLSSCDITFLREVDSLCHGHEDCRQSGHRMALALRALRGRPSHHQARSANLCWQHPCLADYVARKRR
ncbi:hypothetical protein J437_LFUL000266 [Ladona fulva]|uniref:Uncharacterized protein n=1 Tax=Ladona fulva TaxID=123851 RepID=A0A8K0JV56_LADFU|nr:hypothetical protein J437_LFUL000266 [Ladona fulva]